MNKLLILFLAICSTNLCGQGIQFFEGTWEEATNQAGEENKLIFVDAYAKWCGPCKRMAKNVFTNPSVGEYMNENFISVKMDMEEEKGISFGRTYPVSAFPTLFFMDENGEVIKKQVGALQSKEFLDLAKLVLKSFDRSDEYADLYAAGNRDYDLVLKYIKALNSADKSSLKVSNDYLRTANDLSTEQKAEVLFEALTHADSRIFDLFIQERAVIEKLKGKEKVMDKIESACWNTVYNSINFQSEDLLYEAKDKMSRHASDKNRMFALEAEYECAKALADPDGIASSALLLARKKHLKKPDELNQLAEELEMYASIHRDVLEAATEVAKMAVDAEESPAYLLTYARLLHKGNKENKALKVINRAMKNSMIDTRLKKEFEALLKAIEHG